MANLQKFRRVVPTVERRLPGAGPAGGIGAVSANRTNLKLLAFSNVLHSSSIDYQKRQR